MSAIWGLIKIEGSEITKIKCTNMNSSMGVYKLDFVDSWSNKNAYLSCGLQYITPESNNEKQPLFDEKLGLVLVADAIIDNREELFELLNINVNNSEEISDSYLILETYKKFGKDCPKYLVGDFGFVVFDSKNNEFFCARDHVGSRTFYYYYKDNTFAFGTVIKPILETFENKPNINERWIADFLTLPLVVHESEPRETIYKDIFQLQPAHCITYKNSCLKEEKYWDPIKEIKPLKLKTDSEYEEAFKKVFFEAVRCRTRSNGGVGIMLSGGRDSTSVAAVASKYLDDKNKKLKAYSSIPIKEFKNNSKKYFVTDESEYIKSLCDMYKNIELTFCRCENKNSLTDIDYLTDILEQPHKIIENLFWINEIIEKSSEQGCKVLLHGQFGNWTISYGDFLTQQVTLFRGLKFIKLFKEANTYRKKWEVPKAILVKSIIRAILPYSIRKIVSDKIRDKKNEYENIPTSLELLKKWNIIKRIKERGFYIKPLKYNDIKEARINMMKPLLFSQVGATKTKLSLAQGIISRDPTKDKRLIEFCLSIPSEQFVKDGIERRLIYKGMEGIIPDKIRLNYRSRGLQGADWVQRIIRKWENIYPEIENIINNKINEKYFNLNKLKKEFDSIGFDLNDNKSSSLRMLLVSYITANFIERFNKKYIK